MSTTAYEAGATLGLFGASIQYNNSDGWGSSIANSNSVAIQTTSGNSISTMGPISSALGVEHDNDIIYIWLNPVVSMAYQNPNLFNWTNLSANSCDLTDSNDPITSYQAINGCDPNQFPYPDIIGLPVWCLKNPYWPGQGCAQWTPYMKRSWDLSVFGTYTNPANNDKMPQAPGLTLQDYADILQADPFVVLNGNAMNVCHVTYGINVDPNDPEFIPSAPANPSNYNKVNYAGTPSTCTPPGATGGITMTRFQPYGTVEYPEPGPNGLPTTYSGQFQYSQTQTQGTVFTDTHTVSTSWNTTASFGFSFGPAAFDAALTVGGSNSTTWQNQDNTTATNMNGQYASYSITGPQLSDNYNGPPTFNVYLDNVYGTFAFYSDLEPQVTLGDIGVTTPGNFSSCPVANNSQQSFTFPQESVGYTSAPSTFYLLNCSQYPLTMAGPAVTFSDPGFQVVASTDYCSNQVLQAMSGGVTYGSCSFQVVFSPVNSDAPNLIYGTTNPVNAHMVAAGTENASSYQNILITDYVNVIGTAANPSGAVGGTLWPYPVQNTQTSLDPFSQNVYNYPNVSNYQQVQKYQFQFTNYSSVSVEFGPPYNSNGYLSFSDSNADFYWDGPSTDTCYGHPIVSLATCTLYLDFLPVSSPPPSLVYGSKVTIMGSVASGTTAVPLAIAGLEGSAQQILSISPQNFSGALNNPPPYSYNFFAALTIKNNSSIYAVKNLASTASPNTWALVLNGGSFNGQSANCPINGASLSPNQSCTALVEAYNNGQIQQQPQTGTVTVTGQLGVAVGTVIVSASDNGTYTQSGTAPQQITLSGAEQSKNEQVPATYAKGSVTIGALKIPAAGNGNIVVQIGNFNASASYTAGATVADVMHVLVAALNSEGSPVKAKASGSVINFTSVVAGSAGNVALAATGDSNFELLASGSSLTGGKDATTKTIWDGGTVDVTTAGVTAMAAWGSKSTPQSLAKALAASINKVAGTYWKASANGDVISLTSLSKTPPTIELTVTDLKGFSPPSFGAIAQ